MKKLNIILAAFFSIIIFSSFVEAGMGKKNNNGFVLDNLKIYHVEGRRSERVIWFCEEAGKPYELIFKPGDLHASSAKIKEINPLMPLAPTVDYDGKILVESGAIIKMIMEREGDGGMAPALDSDDYLKHMQWFFFAEGSFSGRVSTEFRLKTVQGDGPNKDPMTMRGNKLVDTADLFTYAEDFLVRHPYFGGESFSVADIMMHFPIMAGEMLGVADLDDYPQVKKWKEQVELRPAFLRMRHKSLPGGHLGVPPSLKVKK